MEKFIKEISQGFMGKIGEPLIEALGVVIANSYNKGWEDCKKFYGIKEN